MERFKITSDTLTQGRITKHLSADSYMDALAMMDTIVDELDGLDPYNLDPPLSLTFDELLSGQYGEYHNFHENIACWHFIFKSGWFYSGRVGEEIGQRCPVMEKLDSVYLH